MNRDCDISVIIVNFNGKRYLDVLMESLSRLEHSDFSYEVVFVDNASTDDSAAYLSSLPCADRMPLKIVRSENNLGFAGGNDLGVQNASGKYVVFLNNDTKPDPRWLEELYHYIDSRPDVVMANSKLVFYYDFLCLRFHTQDKILIEKQLQINGKRYEIEAKFCKNALYEADHIVCFGHTEISVPLLDGADAAHRFVIQTISAGEGDTADIEGETAPLFSGRPSELAVSEEAVSEKSYTLIQNAGSGINENYDGYDIGFCQKDSEEYRHPYEITNGCGAAIICRKADFDRCGGFDDAFFMYYEDTDLSFRMKRGGGKIMYCPGSIVRHIHAGSSNEWSPFFTYYVYRNKLLFLKKNIGYKVFLFHFMGELRQGLRERNRSKVRGAVHALIGRTGWQKTGK